MEKEKKVYIRDYKGKDSKQYNELVNSIKKMCHEEENPYNSYKKVYSGFDGDFFIITSVETSSNSYNKPHTTARISVEKIGPDITKTSAIERLLIKEDFKEEIQEK